MNVNNTSDLRPLRDRLLQSLSKAQEQRRQREDWIEYERNSMFDAVTRERTLLGKGPISMELVERAESMACGHVDYSSKFALYCAELVLS